MRGRLPSLDGAVAIVGTRACDRDGEAFAHRLAADLAQAGITVISGGARGIDAAAHRGALSAGGRTLAFLPSYFDKPYPSENMELFRLVEASGALLTEATGPCSPVPWRCLRRNRLVAALSSAVVVVQAPARSGAATTAAMASKLGRPLFAVPASPWEVRGEGCLTLLRRGARICTGVADVLSLAAAEPVQVASRTFLPQQKANEYKDLDEDQGAVMQALSQGPQGVDEMCAALAMGADRVQRAVLTLLLAGAIDEVSSGRYRIVGR